MNEGTNRPDRPQRRDVPLGSGRGASGRGPTGQGAPRGSGAGRPQRPAGGRGATERPRGGQGRDEERRGGTRLTPTSPRLPEPAIDEDVTGAELDRAVHAELRTLSKENAKGVAQHLVMVARRLAEDDAVGALAHAETAARRAGRVAPVREALGLVAYHTGDWARALREFRTVRRLSGSSHVLPYLVDCERGLGRPERALELARSAEGSTLEPAERAELAVVVSGIRRDLGQVEASLAELAQSPLLRSGRNQPWWAALAYAYAEGELARGRLAAAREWFSRAAANDVEGRTDAAERLDELDGTTFVEVAEDEVAEDEGVQGEGELTDDDTGDTDE